jgi:hypothetical protein
VNLLPIRLDAVDWATSGVVTREDGSQYLVIHDGSHAVVFEGIVDAMDLTDLALKVEAYGRQARPARR